MINDRLIEDFQGFLLAFHPHKGFIPLWNSEKESDPKKETLILRFSNFTSGLVSQGDNIIKGMHGPFIVRDLHEHLALIEVIDIPTEQDNIDDDQLLKDTLLFLVILYPVALDDLISGEIRQQLSSTIEKYLSEIPLAELDENTLQSIWSKIKQAWTRMIYRAAKLQVTTEASIRVASVIHQANDFLKSSHHPLQWQVLAHHEPLSYLLPEVFNILISRYPEINFSFHHERFSHSRLTLEYLEIEVFFNFFHHHLNTEIKDFSIYFINNEQECLHVLELLSKIREKNEKISTERKRVILMVNKASQSIETQLIKTRQQLKATSIDLKHHIHGWKDEKGNLPNILADLFQEELERMTIQLNTDD